MKRLKADLHTHSADDPYDRLDYSAEMLIDAVAAAGVDVLAITCHELNVYSRRLAEYARRRNVILIPGIEKFIEGRHVLIYNPAPKHLAAHTFKKFRAIGRRDAVFVAPHPYYPSLNSLRGDLVRNIDLFDGIEWCSLYLRGINPNRWAERAAKAHGLPLVGTTDTHSLPYCDSTYSWIEAEPTVEGVLDAIRQGRVEVVSRPRGWVDSAQAAVGAIAGMVQHVKTARKEAAR